MRPAPSQLQQAITAYRNALLNYDAKALAATQSVYAPIRAALLDQIDQLMALVSANPSLTGPELFRLTRAQELLAQIEAETAKLSGPMTSLVTHAQSTVVQAASAQAKDLAVLSAGAKAVEVSTAWNTLPVNALQDLIGRLSDGSPLKAWVDQFGAQTSQTLQDALTQGLALGLHPVAVAQSLADATDVAGTRLQMFTRQNMLDSYRSSSLRSYSQNDDIVSGWAWVSAQDETVCLSCIALDGQEFDLSESFFPAHLGCRCAARPLIKGVDTTARDTTSEWFDALPTEQQSAMLPKWARDDFQSGKITLQDFAHLQRDNQWGDRYQVATQAQARANAANRGDGG